MEPELVVKFKGDLTDWNAAVAKAKSDMASLDSYMRKAAQANAISARATSNSTTANNQLIASLNSLGRKLSDNSEAAKKNGDALSKNASDTEKLGQSTEKASLGVGSFVKGYLSMAAVMGAGRLFLDSTKEVQKFENQLKVASGTQQDYAKNTQFLEGLAAKYNKNVIDLGANFAQLTIATRGTNMEGAKTERLFAAVTATSAALQMSVDDTNGTFRAFIQMVSKGNVQAEELRGQLGERLYGAFNLAAKSMGHTTQELNKMLENGEVLASDLLPKLTIEMENAFGKDAEANAQNLGSAIEYATGQLTLLIAEAGKTSGVTGFFTQAAKDAGGLISKLKDATKEYGILAALTAGGVSLNYQVLGMLAPGDLGPNIDPLAAMAAKSKKKQEFNKNVSQEGNYITGFPGQYSPKNFALPGDLLKQQIADSKANPVAAEKARKAAESAARKADAAARKWVSEQIQLSNDRIAAGLREAKEAQLAKYDTSGRSGGVTAVEMAGTGWDRKVTPDLSGAYTTFSNESKGDGSATNYDGIVAGMDDAIKQIQIRYNRLQGTTEEFGTQLNDSINNALGTAIVSMVEGVGNLAVGLATGTADMSDVGNAFMGIMAGLFDNIGKALAAHAATLILAKASIATMNIAGSLAGAALAFGAAAVARASIAESSQGAFWTGGIVPHKGGLDAFPIMATGGEMVLNSGQQSRMFGILDGAMSGQMFGRDGGSSSGRSEVVGELRGMRMSSGDIGFSARVGEKKNNYYRSKRR